MRKKFKNDRSVFDQIDLFALPKNQEPVVEDLFGRQHEQGQVGSDRTNAVAAVDTGIGGERDLAEIPSAAAPYVQLQCCEVVVGGLGAAVASNCGDLTYTFESFR